jgi:FtsP/CotA-like multicopper oxidase with cupredoxin domain
MAQLTQLFLVCLFLISVCAIDLASNDLRGLRYEQKVSPLTINGSVYDDYGNKVIWREDKVVYVNLNVDLCRFDEHISFNTRCYNGKYLGPTITVKQGDTLVVYLKNNLGREVEAEDENEVHWPNTTSLHFHGLHASPSQENILKTAYPGENVTIEVYIEEDHYPGTHWYHAHFHGSSHYQVMGGLHGAFIIEPHEPESFYPKFIQNMRPIVMVVSNLKMYAYDNGGWHGYVEYWEGIGDEIDLNLIMDYSQYNNTFIVNGKYQPVIDIEVGEWNWFRFINAGNGLVVPIRFNSTACEHFVIAVDGVFLDEPISTFAYYILAGSRFDIAVRCHHFGNHSVQFYKDPDAEWIYFGVDSADNQVMFTLEAATEYTGESLGLETYEAPTKPSYLTNLMDIPADSIAGRFTVTSGWYDEDEEKFGLSDGNWQGTTNSTIFTMELGKVYEITFLTEGAVHPIHIHVNNMQIINDTEVEWSSFSTYSLHHLGTWRDVIYSTYERNITVRMRPDRFTGYAPIHCHYLIHADRGMMREIELIENSDLVDDSDNNEIEDIAPEYSMSIEHADQPIETLQSLYN